MKKYEKQFIPDYFFILDNICKIKNKTSQYTENNKLKSKGFDNCFTVYFALIKIINDLIFLNIFFFFKIIRCLKSNKSNMVKI